MKKLCYSSGTAIDFELFGVEARVPGSRGAQVFQNIAHQVGAGGGVGQGAFDAQFVVAGQFDVFVFLDELDDVQSGRSAGWA